MVPGINWLMLAASEFEMIAKALCGEAHIPLKWNSDIISTLGSPLGLGPITNIAEILQLEKS